MEEKFVDILEKDEQIIKVMKPNKKRFWKGILLWAAIPIFWPHLILFLVFTFFTLPFFLAKGYNNTYYAYTNKRLIVRSGIFGVDYRSLEYKDITSTTVNVGFLDKKTKTGSLGFVSPSVHSGRPMFFSYVENPYETMREIKEYMESLKAE